MVQKVLKPRRTPAFLWIVFLVMGALATNFILRSLINPGKLSPHDKFGTAETDATVFAQYATSKNCKSCHEDIYRLWETSHHALAERPVNRTLDASAFAPTYQIIHGSQNSTAVASNNAFLISTTGKTGVCENFVPERVIGVHPLRQYLIPFSGGRLQSTELAFGPDDSKWFDVFGSEDRKAGEWGHWTGRGMTWNSMCAACHNTRLRKHYQRDSDSYQTTMAEMGVGCEACHGPMADHSKKKLSLANASGKTGKPAAYKTNDPLRKTSREPMFSVCGSCHSRRAELTGDFRPGDNFYDHFGLTIPDDTEIFYPDGQIHEEDYEFASFLSSRMGAAGVRCTDCHEPHSGKTRLPGNSLCMACHAAPTPPAPKIDPTAHSHHRFGSTGDQCVNCHMPQTVYMQRHARHDHGFTIPDPLLTKQFQIPNACNRCHTERSVEWSIEAVEKWYGPKMQRPSRVRAQVIARARNGDQKVVPELLSLLNTESNAFWRAVSANLLKRWIDQKEVAAALTSSASNASPLLRSASLRALEPVVQSSADPAVQAAFRTGLNDPVRGVRVDAAWAMRANLDTNSKAAKDLMTYLDHNADQPAGQMQLGVFSLDRNQLHTAVSCFERAVEWDPNSAPTRDALAVGLSMLGQNRRAVEQLEAACRLAPRDAQLRFKLGLAFNDSGQMDRARAALEETVKLDPQFARAWYNLGLAYNGIGQPDSALESLLRAESLDTTSPQIPFARATILTKLHRLEEARTAARRALEIEPGYTEAKALLESLPR
jgi:tetratricopeptide (TPR) repeat protein